MKYSIIDTWLPRKIRGQIVSAFVYTGHYINNENFSLAISFFAVTEWECAISFRKHCNGGFRFAFVGIVVELIAN